MVLVFEVAACGVFVPHTPYVFNLPSAVEFNGSVSDNINLLYRNFEDEFVLCIEGQRYENTIALDDFRMPHHDLATPFDVDLKGSCDNAVAIAFFHTHPDSDCYLSRLDRKSFVEWSGLPFAIVMCGPSKAAWWHVNQVWVDDMNFPVFNDQWVTWATN